MTDLEKYIILNYRDAEDNPQYDYTKTITVDEDGNLVTDENVTYEMTQLIQVSTGFDPRPFEIELP